MITVLGGTGKDCWAASFGVSASQWNNSHKNVGEFLLGIRGL